MNLCSRCNKNPAVLYITKMEGTKTSSEGLCLPCAKEMGIAPLNQMLSNFNVSDEELDNLNSQMSDFIENIGSMDGDMNMEEMMELMSGGDPDEGGAATAPFNEMFSNFFGPQSSGGQESRQDTDKSKRKKKWSR